MVVSHPISNLVQLELFRSDKINSGIINTCQDEIKLFLDQLKMLVFSSICTAFGEDVSDPFSRITRRPLSYSRTWLKPYTVKEGKYSSINLLNPNPKIMSFPQCFFLLSFEHSNRIGQNNKFQKY